MMKEIKPADRIGNIQEYYFARKLREVAALNARGLDIVSLGIGGPDKMPPPEVIDTMADETRREGNHSYQPFAGLPELRRAMASWYDRMYGVGLDADTEVLPLIGSKEGILHIDLAFLNPGDGVLVPNPGYPTYTSAARIVGAEVMGYDLTEEGGWMPDFDALERLPLDRVKLMWVNYPHMPTGTPATRGLFERLVDFGRRHGIVIAHDNPYSFILNEEPMSILSVPGAKEVCLEMNSWSKTFNMAGWRLGMLAANPQFMQWVVKVKSNVDSGQFRPKMLAAIKALEQGWDWYVGLNSLYGSRRAIAEEIMTELGCVYNPRQRGMFLWGRLPHGCSGEEFCDAVLRDARVFITPGFIFGTNGEGYVRISLCATGERMAEALVRIKDAKKTGKLL